MGPVPGSHLDYSPSPTYSREPQPTQRRVRLKAVCIHGRHLQGHFIACAIHSSHRSKRGWRGFEWRGSTRAM
jgi:hypothetical protein